VKDCARTGSMRVFRSFRGACLHIEGRCLWIGRSTPRRTPNPTRTTFGLSALVGRAAVSRIGCLALRRVGGRSRAGAGARRREASGLPADVGGWSAASWRRSAPTERRGRHERRCFRSVRSRPPRDGPRSRGDERPERCSERCRAVDEPPPRPRNEERARDEARLAPDEARFGVNEARLVPNEARLVPNEARLVLNEARLVLNEARLVVDEARLVVDEARLVVDEARLAPDEARLMPNEARLVLNEARLTRDEARLTRDEARLALDEARLVPHDLRRRPDDARPRRAEGRRCTDGLRDRACGRRKSSNGLCNRASAPRRLLSSARLARSGSRAHARMLPLRLCGLGGSRLVTRPPGASAFGSSA
jgi:hypothetical protein